MKIRDSVFDSESEKELYSSIKGKWSKKVSIIPQVPLCKIIALTSNEIDGFRKECFPSIPGSYFFQAHTDYTVCDLKGRPLLSIEFDGMYGGYSSGTTYNCDYQWNPERELKLNYKLKLTALVGYPLLVISYQENEPISPGETLTILDGIIGSCIASLQLRSQVDKNFNEMLINSSGAYTDEDCQNLLWDTEIILELEWDPLAKLAAEYCQKCFEKGVHGYGFEWTGEPELPDINDLAQPGGAQRRIDALKNQTGIGCKVRVKLFQGEVVEKVLLRNFDAAHIEPLGIAENIAKYKAFKKAFQILNNEVS